MWRVKRLKRQMTLMRGNMEVEEVDGDQVEAIQINTSTDEVEESCLNETTILLLNSQMWIQNFPIENMSLMNRKISRLMRQNKDMKGIWLWFSIISSYSRRQQYINAMHFFDSYANQEWLVEARVPSSHKKWLRDRVEECKAEAKRLTQWITNDALLIPPEEKADDNISGVVDYSYHIKDIFAERCVYIHSIPPSCTRECLNTFLKQFTGLEAVYFGDVFYCPPSELNRPVYVLFDSRDHAEAAFKHMAAVHIPLIDTENLGLDGLKENETPSTRTFILLCSLWKQMGRPPVLNAIANAPFRIEKDMQQCHTLLHAFEQYWVEMLFVDDS